MWVLTTYYLRCIPYCHRLPHVSGSKLGFSTVRACLSSEAKGRGKISNMSKWFKRLRLQHVMYIYIYIIYMYILYTHMLQYTRVTYTSYWSILFFLYCLWPDWSIPDFWSGRNLPCLAAVELQKQIQRRPTPIALRLSAVGKKMSI